MSGWAWPAAKLYNEKDGTNSGFNDNVLHKYTEMIFWNNLQKQKCEFHGYTPIEPIHNLVTIWICGNSRGYYKKYKTYNLG